MATPIDRLKAYMLVRGLSQVDAAERLGIHQAALSKILAEKRCPNLHTAHAIERETTGWGDGPIRTEEWDVFDDDEGGVAK